jgi:hypothetical protein
MVGQHNILGILQPAKTHRTPNCSSRMRLGTRSSTCTFCVCSGGTAILHWAGRSGCYRVWIMRVGEMGSSNGTPPSDSGHLRGDSAHCTKLVWTWGVIFFTFSYLSFSLTFFDGLLDSTKTHEVEGRRSELSGVQIRWSERCPTIAASSEQSQAYTNYLTYLLNRTFTLIATAPSPSSLLPRSFLHIKPIHFHCLALSLTFQPLSLSRWNARY